MISMHLVKTKHENNSVIYNISTATSNTKIISKFYKECNEPLYFESIFHLKYLPFLLKIIQKTLIYLQI